MIVVRPNPDQAILSALATVIDLPQRITALDLRMRLDELTTLTVTSQVITEKRLAAPHDHSERFEREVSEKAVRYRLVPVED